MTEYTGTFEDRLEQAGLLGPQRTFIDSLRAHGLLDDEKPAPSMPTNSTVPSAYLKRAMDAEVAAVRAAPEGTRNDRLNRAAFALGQLVAGAGLDRALVEAELHAAALLSGLNDRETMRTIASGLDAGAEQPRTPTTASGVRSRQALDEAVANPCGGTLITLAEVTPERVVWLWRNRLPLGKIVVLDGDPAVGKSTVCADFAARVSAGSSWPDGSSCPAGHVIVLSAEDGLADTIRPRLDAAGADTARVHALTEIRYTDEDGKSRTRSVTLADIAEIEQTVRSVGALLVVVDVLMAYLPGRVDSHRDQDIRTVLAELAGMAERTGCCVLLLRHLNKATGGNPLYRGGGSIGIVGAARAAMLAAIDPDDETRRVLAVTKSNLAALPEALAYRLADSPEHGCARVEWLGSTEHRASDLLGRHEDDDERSERDEAGEWLLAYLTNQGSQAKAADIFKAARADGIAERTLRRARQRVGVESIRRGFGEGAFWSIAATVRPFLPGPESGPQRQECGPNDERNERSA